jgi:FK506-binding nuclear protein
MKGLIIAAVVVGGTLIALFIWSDMNDLSNKKKGVPVDDSRNAKKTDKLDNFKVEIKDEKIGEGPEAKPGDTLTVLYTGTLKNGTQFGSNKSSGKPYTFLLGAGEVIKGWDQGMVGMKKGGIRTLIVPPELGYRDQKKGEIPPNSELTFKVELLRIN